MSYVYNDVRFTFRLNISCGEWYPPGIFIKKSMPMVDKMCAKSRLFQLFWRCIFCQFINHCRQHFKMREFFGRNVIQDSDNFTGDRITLIHIAKRCSQFPIRTSILLRDVFRELRIARTYLNRIQQFFFINPHCLSPSSSLPWPRC